MIYLYCNKIEEEEKMKSNKGFTLIELLAVIVILAIIALIATPIILGVIETARQGSAENSALGYIDAVEKQIAIDMLGQSDKKVTIGEDNTISIPDGATMAVKGEAPTSGSLTVDATTGVVSDGCMIIELNGTSFKVTYDADGEKAATAAKGTSCE